MLLQEDKIRYGEEKNATVSEVHEITTRNK